MTLKREIEKGCENSAGDWHASTRLDCQAMARTSGAVRWSLPGVSVLGRHDNITEIVHSYKLASMVGRADAGRYNSQIKLIGLVPLAQINLRLTIIISRLLCLLNKE